MISNEEVEPEALVWSWRAVFAVFYYRSVAIKRERTIHIVSCDPIEFCDLIRSFILGYFIKIDCYLLILKLLLRAYLVNI